MKRLLLFYLPILLCLSISSCTEENISSYTNPHIEEFYFNEHKRISGIEDVKFTIDTVACLIFNEDSISYGCDLSKLLPVPVSYESLNSIKVNDESWNYKDSIDMSSPITISTVAGNKKRSATYTVTLNKHKIEPDSIIWQESYINEYNITSINSCEYNKQIYVFINNDKSETKIYNSNTSDNFTLVHSSTDLEINFYKSIIHNGKCFATSSDNKSLYYLDLSDINSGFKLIELPENSEIIDLWGILSEKLFATLRSDSPKYMSFDGTEWKEEICNRLDELTTLGSAKINNSNTLFIISGSLNGNLTNNVLATQDGNYWINTINESDTLLYEPVENACVVDYYNYFYLCGGKNKEGKIATSYYSKNDGYSWLPLKSYQRPSNGFTPKEHMSASSLNDYIYIFNSNTDSNIEVWRGRINKADFIIKK
ncbi:MAG: hypothetical protein IKA83_02940 [Paludibacteraceae bacterium]|nr:hypothetical protein [Paludibacteraceae bacterium]